MPAWVQPQPLTASLAAQPLWVAPCQSSPDPISPDRLQDWRLRPLSVLTRDKNASKRFASSSQSSPVA